MTDETRYLDSLGVIPKGPFYDSEGNIVPYRGPREYGSLTPLRLITNFPNERFLILINDVQFGIVTTDSNGNAIFELPFPLGDIELILQREFSTDKIRVILTTREFAVWLASIATSIEDIDDFSDETLNSFYLAFAGAEDLELAHGVPLITPNEFSADADTYREILQLVRQSFRQFAGRTGGKFGVVGAVTQVNPLILKRYKQGPRWVLGYDQLFDNLQNSSRYATSLFTNINAVGQLAAIVSVDDYVNTGGGTLAYHRLMFAFVWTPPIASTINIDPALRYEGYTPTDGQFTIPSGRARAFIDSQHFPLTVTATVADHLYIELDSIGTIVDVNLLLNGGLGGIGTLTIDTVINGFFRSRAPYNRKRRATTQPSVLLASYVDVVRVSDDTATGTATLQTTIAPNRIRYSAPGDSVGTYVLSNFGGLTRVYSNNGVDYVDIFTVSASASSDTFIIGERYLTPASLIAGNDQLRITSQNEHVTDGPSEVTIHDGGGNAASFPLASFDRRGHFNIPQIDTILSAAVTATDTSIQIPAGDIDKFSIANGVNNFPFNIIVGYGSKSSTASFTVTSIPNQIATVNTSVPFFAVGDTHVNIYMDSTISGTRNIGVHKILSIADSQNATIAYGGVGVPQPNAFITGVSCIGVHQDSSGSGTLNYLVATPTLDWTAPGDSAGAAINVGAGGYFRLFSNNGVEYVDILVDSTGLPGSDQFETLFISKFRTTTASGNDLLTAWSSGEVARVISVTPGTPDVWNLQSPIVGNYLSGQSVYLANDILPLNEVGEDSFGDLTLNVDISEAPVGAPPATDAVTVSGSDLPDGWLFTGIGTPTIYITPESKYRRGAIFFQSATAISVDKELPLPEASFGSSFTFRVYVRNVDPVDSTNCVLRLGFDFGFGFIYSSNFTIFDANVTSRRPELLEFTQILPTNATQFKIQIDRVSDGVDFMLERVVVVQNYTHGLYLGHFTTPRSDGRSKFGELFYVWSPDELSSDVEGVLGLAAPATNGLIQQSHNAHEEIDAFNVTNVLSGSVTNVRGVFTEAEFLSCALTNMEIIGRNPTKYSYAKPNRISAVEGEQIIFSTPSPHKASLAIISDQDQTQAVLYEDGIPVPNDQWQFNTATEIEVISGFNSSAVYIIDYQALIQIESIIIDIESPTNNGNETWFADYLAWNRHASEIDVVRDTTAVIFNAAFNAILPRRSDGNKLRSVLIEDTGISQRTIPQSAWRYLDTLTVNMDGSEFNPNALYSFEYNQQIVDPNRVVNIVAEIKSATSVFSLGSAAYNQFDLNAGIDGTLRYHQIRLTLSGVIDLRDIRIHSMVLKGLNLTGSGSPPPGL
jgi:hypothetical protein